MNNAEYNYTYISDGNFWKVEAVLESSDYQKLMQDDGGDQNDKYEVGTNIKTL